MLLLTTEYALPLYEGKDEAELTLFPPIFFIAVPPDAAIALLELYFEVCSISVSLYIDVAEVVFSVDISLLVVEVVFSDCTCCDIPV